MPVRKSPNIMPVEISPSIMHWSYHPTESCQWGYHPTSYIGAIIQHHNAVVAIVFQDCASGAITQHNASGHSPNNIMRLGQSTNINIPEWKVGDEESEAAGNTSSPAYILHTSTSAGTGSRLLSKVRRTNTSERGMSAINRRVCVRPESLPVFYRREEIALSKHFTTQCLIWTKNYNSAPSVNRFDSQSVCCEKTIVHVISCENVFFKIPSVRPVVSHIGENTDK
ncbi:hypothetical protein J6590_031025 [Homalodisca vitripennis]|nr:hypothetical protein J6590_031025 [Homalodisca vitripennis]